MSEERRVDQLYVFISRMKADPPSLDMPDAEIAHRHHAYLSDLQQRKILVGSGAAKDETGQRHAGGLIILRANSLAEAHDIAGREPYCREGQRTVEIIPWRRTWFDDESGD